MGSQRAQKMATRKTRIKLLRTVFVLFALSALFTGHPWMGRWGIDCAVKSVGYVLLAAGLGFRLWAILYIGSRKSKELITEGPYSLCRNPLYLGTFAIYLGAALCLENLVLCILFVGVVIPVHLLVVLSEERQLSELFPQEYDEYRKKVPRFRISRKNYSTPKNLTISTKVVQRAALEAFIIASIPPLGHVIEVLQVQEILPVLWVFP